MFDISTASIRLRKAAYVVGVKGTGQWEPISDTTYGPEKQVAKVYNQQHPDGIVITAGEQDYADHYTWSELRKRY